MATKKKLSSVLLQAAKQLVSAADGKLKIASINQGETAEDFVEFNVKGAYDGKNFTYTVGLSLVDNYADWEHVSGFDFDKLRDLPGAEDPADIQLKIIEEIYKNPQYKKLSP